MCQIGSHGIEVRRLAMEAQRTSLRQAECAEIFEKPLHHHDVTQQRL